MNGMVARVLLSARIIIPLEARKTHTLMALHTAGPFCCRPQGVRQRNEDCNKRIEERRYRRMLGAGST